MISLTWRSYITVRVAQGCTGPNEESNWKKHCRFPNFMLCSENRLLFSLIWFILDVPQIVLIIPLHLDKQYTTAEYIVGQRNTPPLLLSPTLPLRPPLTLFFIYSATRLLILSAPDSLKKHCAAAAAAEAVSVLPWLLRQIHGTRLCCGGGRTPKQSQDKVMCQQHSCSSPALHPPPGRRINPSNVGVGAGPVS